MPTLKIDGKDITVEAGKTVLQACEEAGISVPRFCYHERLSIAGNCRMCLVEMERSPKPIASCAMPAGEGMVIHTNTETVKKAREGVMEFLLINHPLDCPICDQGGECDLQDQAVSFGRSRNRYDENKRAVTDKNMGPLIDTTMTRCIHCMRCVRFSSELAGVDDMGALYRGENSQIVTYLDGLLDSEMSGNVIDLCPVGALTSKPYSFTARSWELTHHTSIDVMDAVGSNISVDVRGNTVMRINPVINDDVNEEWISDKTRFAYDGLTKRRLDRPYIKKKGKFVEASWSDAFVAIQRHLRGLKGSEIAAIVGDQADMESMKALKDLLAKRRSNRVECRQDSAAHDAANRAGYIMNSMIKGLDEADYVLLVGANIRCDAPVINTRILKNVKGRGLSVGVIGDTSELNFRVEDHGNDPSIITKLSNGRHAISKKLKAAKKPMIIVGDAALCRSDGAAILAELSRLAEQYCNTEDWNGFNVLHTAASRVGGLDLGLTTEGGVESILVDAEAGDLKAVILLGADEIDTSRLAKTFTVYLGTHGDAGVSRANVILPAAAYTEKSGTYANTEGRLQRTERAVPPLGDAREDWAILRALSDKLNVTLPYNNLSELRASIDFAGDLGVFTKAEWGDFGKSGDIDSTSFVGPDGRFYQSNPIARASETMAECVAVRCDTQQEATGTNG